MDSIPWPIIVSGCSLVLSAFALYLTYRQKIRQDRFGARKALSDLISAISNTHIEFAKLKEKEYDITQVVALRRTLNAQRRFLAYHADILAHEIPKLTADIDHLMIASAFKMSDPDLAGAHYEQSVKKARNALTRAINTRSYAQFLFHQGSYEAAREMFEKALMENNDNDDRSRWERADILAVWATAERRYGYSDEARMQMNRALAEAEGITNAKLRDRAVVNLKARYDEPAAVARGDEHGEQPEVPKWASIGPA